MHPKGGKHLKHEQSAERPILCILREENTFLATILAAKLKSNEHQVLRRVQNAKVGKLSKKNSKIEQ